MRSLQAIVGVLVGLICIVAAISSFIQLQSVGAFIIAVVLIAMGLTCFRAAKSLLNRPPQ
jgi:sulfite exporter TauE/SafE